MGTKHGKLFNWTASILLTRLPKAFDDSEVSDIKATRLCNELYFHYLPPPSLHLLDSGNRMLYKVVPLTTHPPMTRKQKAHRTGNVVVKDTSKEVRDASQPLRRPSNRMVFTSIMEACRQGCYISRAAQAAKRSSGRGTHTICPAFI